MSLPAQGKHKTQNSIFFCFWPVLFANLHSGGSPLGNLVIIKLHKE